MRFFSRPDIRDQRIKHMEETIERLFKTIESMNADYLKAIGESFVLRNLNDQLKAELATERQRRWDGNESAARERDEEVLKLKAENEALRVKLEVSEDTRQVLRGSLAQAEVDIDALRKDAERYRLVRDRYQDGDLRICIEYKNTKTGSIVIVDGDHADILIDGAIRKVSMNE